MVFLLANETDLQASSWLHHGVCSFWWRSRCVITSLHNVPMATGENGCSCVKQTQHFSTFCWDICDFFATKMRGLWNHASPAYFAQKSWKYADFGWLCIELCDRIIAFFWRDWLMCFYIEKWDVYTHTTHGALQALCIAPSNVSLLSQQ